MRLEHWSVSLTRFYLFFQVVDELGRLIAIMLGRFRMTVPDCKLEYENLAVKVFGKSRHFTTLNFGLVDRTKYDAANVKKVFEEVTERRSEKISKGQRRITFPSKRGLCKTLVSFPFSLSRIPQPRAQNTRNREMFSWYTVQLIMLIGWLTTT